MQRDLVVVILYGSVYNQYKIVKKCKIADIKIYSLLVYIPSCVSTVHLKIFFKVHRFVHRENIPIYIQQDATLHSLFISGNCSTCFGWYLTHNQERIQLYLQHLVFVRPLLLPAAIVAGSSNGLTNTRCCRYSCMRP